MSRIEYDVVLVGGSPSNLTLAYRLVELADKPVRIAVVEKAKEMGGHLLSGAVSNPRVIKKLFPDWANGDFPLEGICKNSYLSIIGANGWADAPRLFMPPVFKKEGYAILNISDMAAYMSEKISEKAAEKERVIVDFYPGFPAQEILYDGNQVIGVKVDNTGSAPDDSLYGKVTVFGDKGFISRDLVGKFNLRPNGQTWAVGVKEVWETEQSYEGKVWHMTGFPLAPGHLGGGFMYGCKNNKLIIGLVMALDHADPNLRPPQALQDMKKNPFIQKMIKGGTLLKYGAAVLPEGGYYSLPSQFAVNGALLVGDALGTLDVKRFSGVDKAMESGYIAAEVIKNALDTDTCTAAGLAPYKEKFLASWAGKELYDARYFKKAFKDYPGVLGEAIPALARSVDGGSGVIGAGISYGLSGPFKALGNIGAGKMINAPGDHGAVTYEEDRTRLDPNYQRPAGMEPRDFDNGTVHSTADIVFYAHTHYEEDNNHIEEFDPAVCVTCIDQYSAVGKDTPCVGDCTAEVHEVRESDGKKSHGMALENCVQCTTCEIVCPSKNIRVRAALHGYGPNFSGM